MLCLAACIPSSYAVAARCPGGTPIQTFRVLLQPRNAQPALPLTQVNLVEAGETLRYEPVHLPANVSDKAKVAVVLIAEKDDGTTDIRVLQPKQSRSAQEWPIPVHASVVGLVFGEHGLDVKKVRSVVSDPQLVSQLADYADRSSKVEALVQTLAKYEDSAPGSSDLQSMLHGFSSQYGVSLPRLDSGAPADQQANALLQALVPAFKPDDSGASLNLAEHSTGLAASVASMFFGPQVGLAAGGAALLENLHTVMFPGTAFRPAFTQEVTQSSGLELCSGAAVEKTRKNVAYLWMQRTPDAPAPKIQLADSATVAAGWTSQITATTASVAQLKLLPRVRDWKLVAGASEVPVAVHVTPGETSDILALDLRKAKVVPGKYQLAGMWDWTPITASGTVDVRSPGDLTAARLTDESADALISGSGDVNVQLTGTDFEFVNGMSLRPANAAVSKASAVAYEITKGDGDPSLHATIDTSSLRPGAYLLRVQQVNGTNHDLPVTVHPANPKLSDLPLRVNVGETEQTVVLRGSGLERIDRITSTDAAWELSPSDNTNQREATVKLAPNARPGEMIEAKLFVNGLHNPVVERGALRVLGPRPKIEQITKSLAGDAGVEIHDGEVPAGTPASFSIRAQNVEPPASIELSCKDGRYAKQDLILRTGEKKGALAFESAGQGVLFLSVDPGSVGQPECALQAKMITSDGSSEPYTLGTVVSIPHIDKLTITGEKLGPALYAGTLTGENLEAIAKTGWSKDEGNDVRGIATPVPGSATEQTLKIAVPWPPPSPQAPLYVWLLGDTAGRLTNTKY